jgi:SAM-dependent methyltransferase
MFQKITRKKLQSFLSRYGSKERTLDIGSGGALYGYNAFFPNIVTADIDPARKPEVIADIQSLPFKDGEFTNILCAEVLEHVPDSRKAASELYRVLAPGGMLILTTRFVYPIHDAPGDYWRFTKYSLQMLFDQEHWEIVELAPETEAFSTIGVLLQRMCFQSTLRFNKLTKFALFSLAAMFDHLNWLIVKEYGNIQKSVQETAIMPSGYHLAARKRIK